MLTLEQLCFAYEIIVVLVKLASQKHIARPPPQKNRLNFPEIDVFIMTSFQFRIPHQSMRVFVYVGGADECTQQGRHHCINQINHFLFQAGWNRQQS